MRILFSLMNKCFFYDFNSEKKFLMKCPNDEKLFVDKRMLLLRN
jgi:hypothetical protein